MIRSGLVSITFRTLSVGEIIRIVAEAGLDGIEWGSDVHCPAGDVEIARDVAKQTAEAGLAVAAYGSYYRLGETEPFEPILESAVALGAPTIRVWAGKSLSSADASDADRQRVADDLNRIAAMSAEVNIAIALEYHANTLTDTLDSALDLLAEAPGVACYWQPPFKSTVAENLRTIPALVPRLSNIHVFHWIDDGTDTIDRRPLAEGLADWAAYVDAIAGIPGDRWAMLEFVRDDALESFIPDAAALRNLLADL
jgi:3-dehydroshikimate dehydratase